MWTIYFPHGHAEEFPGLPQALERILSVACSRGWDWLDRDFTQDLLTGPRRDTYLINTPSGTYQIDNSSTCT